MKRIISMALALVLSATALVGCNSSGGGTYPNQTVSVIVPYSAGGGTDLVTRAIVDAAKGSFPKNISVENKTGGGGAVGMVYGAAAKPDGNVITTVTVELTTLPHTGTGGNLQIDQFKPIMMMNSAYAVVAVKSDAQWNTIEELVEYSKSNKVQVGNSGVGAIWHLAAAAFAKASSSTLIHVPFEGAAPAITSLLGGHIEAVTCSYPEVAPQVQAGELKVLVAMSEDRLANAPDVPTAKEKGYDAVVGTWRGLAVPKDTPQETCDKIFEIFKTASETDAFKEFMKNNNLDIDVLNSEEFSQRIASDNEMFKTLIADLGLSK